MLAQEFFDQSAHFAVTLLAALAFFAAFWLHFDAWTERKSFKALLTLLGFLLLSVSFLIHSSAVESSFFGSSVVGDFGELAGSAVRLVAYLALVYGLVIDPIQPLPNIPGRGQAPALTGLASASIKFALPILSVLAGLLYYRKVRVGLERHLSLVAYTFFALAASEFFGLASLWRGSSNVTISNLTAPFGPLWILEHIALLLATAILSRWVWQYLTKRILTQLFMVLTSAVVVIFLITTVSFTSLLMSNIEQSSLRNLATEANVLEYAAAARAREAQAVAETVAQNPAVVSSTAALDHTGLAAATAGILEAKELTSLIIAADSGQVLLRAEDTDRWGDSISEDPLFKNSVQGEATHSVAVVEGVLTPAVAIRGTYPVRSADRVVGVVVASFIADNSFVDGVKAATGLDSAVYAGNVRSATTLISPDGKSRHVGVKEENSHVKTEVLMGGRNYQAKLNILNTPYLAAYVPLKDIGGSVVGMLFVGEPQLIAYQAAGRSVELTFIVAVTLLLLSIVPTYKIAKYMTYQLS